MAQAMVCSSGLTDYNIPGVCLRKTTGLLTRLTDIIYYHPFRVNDPLNVTEIAVAVYDAGTDAVIGIYTADVNLEPAGSPIGGDIDIDVSSVAVHTATVDLDLDRGTYLAALQVSETTSFRGVNGFCPDTVGFGIDGTFTNICGSLIASTTYDGTNPDPGLAPEFGLELTDGGFDHLIGYKYTVL